MYVADSLLEHNRVAVIYLLLYILYRLYDT